MNKTRMYLSVPAAALVVSFFMPYFRLGRISGATGLDAIGDGGIAILLLLGAVAMIAGALLPKPKAKISSPYDMVYLGGAVVTVLYYVLLFVRGSDAVRLLGDGSLKLIGIGAWVGLVSGVVGIYFGIAHKKLK